MRKGGGKSKGSAFERDVCVRLSLWTSYGQHEDVYWRSSMSGGRSTVAFAKGKRLATQAGDICAINPLGHAFTDKFLIECKNYKDLNFTGLLTEKGNLVKFWSKAKEQASQYKKLPLLIAKQNQLPAVVLLSREGAEELGMKLKTIVCAPRLNMYISSFADFLKWATRVGGTNASEEKG